MTIPGIRRVVLGAILLSILVSGCAGTRNGGQPSGPVDPACMFGPDDEPARPSATSHPLFAVETTSAWSSPGIQHPDAVVYDDRTIATQIATPRPTPSRSTAAKNVGRAPIIGYLGGKIDKCPFERITEGFEKLRGLDFGQTGIMDGSYIRIDFFGGKTLGSDSIGVDNLHADAQGLTTDQKSARQRLISWLDELDSFVRAGELPLDRLVVLDGILGKRQLDAAEPLAWTGKEPAFDKRCALLTGKVARQALADAGKAGDRSSRDSSAVFYATFTMGSVSDNWALMSAAPGFGCTAFQR